MFSNMHLVPLELSLTVGAGAAALIVGFIAWWKNKWGTGNVLYALMAFSLAMWTLADWFVSLEAPLDHWQVLGWKFYFYFSVCFGPAIVMHATSRLASRGGKYGAGLFYLSSSIATLLLYSAILAREIKFAWLPQQACLQGAALLVIILYALATFHVAFQLYPQAVSKIATTLEKRRAIYGLVILTVFMIAGVLQMIIGPVPTGLMMPFIAIVFLVFSLMSFVRTSFLDVELGNLEAFFLFLAAYALVIVLRSDTREEAIVALLGSLIVGVFGLISIRTVKGEKTKRRLLEDSNRQLRMLEEAKSDFIDMVAHQLRGPLGGVRAASAMLTNGDLGELPEKARKMVGQMQDTVSRLLSLSETFLNASRLEMGKYQSVRVPTDVRQELHNITTEMDTVVAAKDLKLEVEVSDVVPQVLDMDKEVLENVLFNLLDNAVKYTDHGGIKVAATLEGRNLKLVIADSGPGLTDAECNDLFKKFHRGKVGRSHQTDGTGLGLYIVKQLIEAVGGSIGVVCDKQRGGSVFTVKLPCGLV
ncbi:MAG: HAMP domain-containing sensor histidine kinase [Patescibacteria group bacterium]|nr:HAMP domain-containing sensor histidine kinase [Patescibacteria group bacterium]